MSVVLANWNRARMIPSIVEQLASQTYPKDRYEVIIVDDDSADLGEVRRIVGEVVHKHDDIKFRFFETHKNLTRNPALRYNIGARNSKGQLIVLNETDLLMQGEYLQRVNEDHNMDDRLWLGPEVVHLHRDGRREVEAHRGLCDLGSSIRREHYFAVRGFDERTRGWGGIESDFGRRLNDVGVRYRKDPRLVVLHRAIELCGIDAAEFFKDAAKPGAWPPYVGTTPNPETWGTLETLEEVKL
jgi:glycosyltransferase involved in cell wall biosynthesis